MNVLAVFSPGLKVLFERVGKPEVVNGPDFFRFGGAGAVIACNHFGWADSLWMACRIPKTATLRRYCHHNSTVRVDQAFAEFRAAIKACNGDGRLHDPVENIFLVLQAATTVISQLTYLRAQRSRRFLHNGSRLPQRRRGARWRFGTLGCARGRRRCQPNTTSRRRQ